MSERNDGGPAFPTSGPDNGVWGAGMTVRQYAAIKLRVPDSGTDWLDDMIRRSLRDEAAAKAMQGDWAAQNAHTGEIQNKVSTEYLEGRAAVYYRAADAMLAAREGS